MHFALLGNHPDGRAMASALVASGRHHLVVCSTSLPTDDTLWRGVAPRRVADIEEILADPAVDAVVIASAPTARPQQLRRALQAERHVLCVCPPDDTPDIAYEAAMLQADTKCVLLPLLTEALHPAIRRLGQLVGSPRQSHKNNRIPGAPASRVEPDSSPEIGFLRLLTVARAHRGEVLDGFQSPGQKPTFPGWDLLRFLGGDVAEVSGFAAQEELLPGQEVLLSGRFERGGLLQVILLPNRPSEEWRLTLVGERGHVELYFPTGGAGPAFLSWHVPGAELREEGWAAWDPWPCLVQQFEAALANRFDDSHLTWQDAVRALELDDTARRSIARRRSGLLEYQEVSEEVGFKGTMTLVGCSVLLFSLILLILAAWVPQAGYLIVPLLAGFLLLQTLRSLAAKKPDK